MQERIERHSILDREEHFIRGFTSRRSFDSKDDLAIKLKKSSIRYLLGRLHGP
jgi:hypothetical protein